MKSPLLNLTLVLMLFLSCKKEHTIGTPIVNPNSTTYKVSFKAGFTQTSSTFAGGKHLNNLANASVDTNMVNNLIFVVYDSVGKVVQVQKQALYQIPADTLFGSVNFILRSGKYTAIIAGCGGIDPLQYYSANGEPGPSNLNTDVINYTFQPNTFYKKVTFTVAQAPINQSVSLDRIVSRLTVVIQGGLPATKPPFYFSYTAEAAIISGASSFYFVGSSSPGPGSVYNPNDNSNNVTLALPLVPNTALYGTGNYVLTALVLASSSPMVVDIKGYRYNNSTETTVAAERKVSVTCIPNTETILTGDLFGINGATGGSDVNINTTWKSEVITKSFGN